MGIHLIFSIHPRKFTLPSLLFLYLPRTWSQFYASHINWLIGTVTMFIIGTGPSKCKLFGTIEFCLKRKGYLTILELLSFLSSSLWWLFNIKMNLTSIWYNLLYPSVFYLYVNCTQTLCTYYLRPLFWFSFSIIVFKKS